MRHCFTDLKISFHTCGICRRSHILFMPFVCCCCQLRTIFTYGPGSALVKTDRQTGVQVRIISCIQLSDIIISHCIRNFTLCNLGYQILGSNAVIGYLMNQNASSQLFIQVNQSFVIFARFHIYIFSDQLSYIF